VKYEEIIVHILLLDLRFDADKRSGDKLGEDQLAWLNEKLDTVRANVTIIVSGIQIIPDRYFYYESFGPLNKEKVFNLLQKHNVSGVVFLSGDVHFA
jgi:alkaline phosphatase D